MAENDTIENIVTIEELAKYSGVYPEADDTTTEIYIESAQDILFSYLGYDPRKQSYTKFFKGKGTTELRVSTKPITQITAFKMDGMVFRLENLAFSDDTVYFTDMGVFPKDSSIQLDFIAGFEKVPAIMKMTVLRIATLLQLESDNNIGVSSRSFADSSRTFLNTTNYDKYLIQCSRYKLLF